MCFWLPTRTFHGQWWPPLPPVPPETNLLVRTRMALHVRVCVCCVSVYVCRGCWRDPLTRQRGRTISNGVREGTHTHSLLSAQPGEYPFFCIALSLFLIVPVDSLFLSVSLVPLISLRAVTIIIIYVFGRAFLASVLRAFPHSKVLSTKNAYHKCLATYVCLIYYRVCWIYFKMLYLKANPNVVQSPNNCDCEENNINIILNYCRHFCDKSNKVNRFRGALS